MNDFVNKWFPPLNPNLASRYTNGFIRNRKMIKEQQIEQFANKHRMDYIGPTGDGVQGFVGGRFFSDEDILIDLEKDVPVGLIELYMAEATSGHVRDFETWLVEHRYA